LGHLTGGYLTDVFQTRGSPSPAAPVMMFGLLMAVPCVLLFGSTNSLSTSLIAYGLLNFSITMGAPASLAGVQMLTPDRLRGVVTSMFLAVTTLVGIGMGPPLIGLLTDNVFGGPLGLNRSLMVAFTILAILGSLLALASRRPFQRAALAAAQPGTSL
jgi:sugar phosphate permease